MKVVFKTQEDIEECERVWYTQGFSLGTEYEVIQKIYAYNNHVDFVLMNDRGFTNFVPAVYLKEVVGETH